MRAAKSLKPEVPRPVSSPSSPDDLWPEPSSALFISWRPAREGAGAPLPSCQPRSWLERLGLNQAARVLRLRHCSPPEVPGESRTRLSADPPCHLRSRSTQSKLSATRLFPFLFPRERSCCDSLHPGRHPDPCQSGGQGNQKGYPKKGTGTR